MSRPWTPPGWPPEVAPPGSEDFPRTARGWLLDHGPAEFRGYEVLRRHPVLLARLAADQLAGAVQGCRDGYRTARAELRDAVSPEAVEQLLDVYQREGRRLAAAERAARLLGRALAGESFVEPL